MKKIVLILIFTLSAMVSFSQTYTARKLYGNYQFIVCDTTACDTIYLYPEAGYIKTDMVVFGDGTYMTTNTFVKVTGDTMNGTYRLNTGSFNFGSGVNLNLSEGENAINFSNTTSYNTKGVKITDDQFIMRSAWESTSAIGSYIAPDTIILSGGYSGSDGDTLTHESMSAIYYTFKIPSVEFTGDVVINGRINGIEYNSDSTVSADDASIVLTDSIYGWGEVYAFNAGAIDEWAEFIISSDGAVYLKSNSTDVVNTDTDNKLCIFDNGTGVKIRNRLGGTRTIKYIIHH